MFETLYAAARAKTGADELDALNKAAEDTAAKLVDTETKLADTSDQLTVTQTVLEAARTALRNVSPPGYADLHLHGDWAAKTDPSIGPWPAGSSYTFTQFQKVGDAQNAMVLSVKGPAGGYADILIGLTRRPLLNPGRLSYRGRLWSDAAAPNAAQAVEVDTIVSKGGQRYNLSSQINYYEGGMLQVANGGWVDTGIMVGKLQPLMWHTFQWDYYWDDVAHKYGFLAFTLDGKKYAMPTSLQSLVSVATNWGDGVHPQLQLDTNSKGVGYSFGYDALSYWCP